MLGAWIPEISKYCPKVPIVLVGTMEDLRHEDTEEMQTKEEVPVAEADAVRPHCILWVACHRATVDRSH